MKNLGIQDKKCEEPSKETDIQYITQSQYNNVCLPNMSENSSSISPSHQINTENQSNDDTGIIHSNHIKIDPKEEIAEIKIETESITTKSNLENSQKTNKRKVEKQEDEQVKVQKINKKIEKVSEEKTNTEVKKEEKDKQIKSLFEGKSLLETRQTTDLAEPPDKKRKKTNPGELKLAMNIALIVFLITVATGAQIGTSHKKISIMQIDSMKISRTTWITTEEQEGPMKIL